MGGLLSPFTWGGWCVGTKLSAGGRVQPTVGMRTGKWGVPATPQRHFTTSGPPTSVSRLPSLSPKKGGCWCHPHLRRVHL